MGWQPHEETSPGNIFFFHTYMPPTFLYYSSGGGKGEKTTIVDLGGGAEAKLEGLKERMSEEEAIVIAPSKLLPSERIIKY